MEEDFKKTILVVDDEKMIRNLLNINLTKEGYNVIEAVDGLEAVELATEKKPDLILLDVMIPKLDGLSVCKRIKNTMNVPILMVTAKDSEVDKILGLELGADDYVTKPFSIRELIARIKANLRKVEASVASGQITNGVQKKENIIKVGVLTLDLDRFDVMLPKIDGLTVCKRIKSQMNVPILMVTAKDEELDKIIGLELGADDYITKPFSVRELLARVKANLRKNDIMLNMEKDKEINNNEDKRIKRTNILKVGVLTLDLDRFEVMVNDRIIDLTLREFEVLKFLATEPGQVVTRETLLEKVWGYEYYGDIRTVDVTVRRIREKIERDTSNPKILITKRGVGYYLAS